MSFRTRSEEAAKEVLKSLGATPDEAGHNAIIGAIEKAIIEAVAEANQQCTQVAMKCCSADQDTAHKIASEIERKHQSLIANLSSLR